MKVCVQYGQKYSVLHQTDEIIYKSLDSQDKGIGVIALNRPKQKNALSKGLVDNFQKIIKHLNNETRVLIIQSLVPGVFCAGADLKERETMPVEEVGGFVSKLRSLMQEIYNLPMPVIACLDGVALGGGLEMSLACDIRVCSDNVKMGLVEGKLAIIPGAGGTQRLPRLINSSIAKELIYTARIINANDAHKLGLVNHVVSQNNNGDAAYHKSVEIGREILENGPIAIRMAKKSINKGLEMDIEEGLKVEEFCYSQLIQTEDRVEGLKAFKEKRKPRYVGK